LKEVFVDPRFQQRLLRSYITPEDRKNVSLVLAALTHERLKEVNPGLVVSALVQFAVLLKALDDEGGIGPLMTERVDIELKELNILDIIDLYVAHRPEES
jgi:hypothetical protein